MASCRSCHAEVLWTRINGKPHPLDPTPIDVAQCSQVAVNPATGAGHVLKQADLDYLERWRDQGVQVYISHFATCPNAVRHRKKETT